MKHARLLLIFFLTACGTVATTAPEDGGDPSVNTDFGDGDSQVFFFATDYASSGQLYVASLVDGETSLANSGLTLLGTEAVVRYADDLLYILHAGGNFNSVSTDNVQIVDPFDDYATVAQFSTGNGTNPQDMVVSGNSAFISLYNPKSDPANVDGNGDPADVIEMNLTTGAITHRYSFASYLNADGDLNANAFQMALSNGTLYVILQDLTSNTFTTNAPGLIGKIDVAAHAVDGVITLQGRNPAYMVVSDDGGTLFVASTNDRAFNTTYSGLEVIDLNAETQELFLRDSSFAGYVEKLRKGDGQVYMVISKFNATNFTFNPKIMRFADTIDSVGDVEAFFAYGTDIRDAFVQNDRLWVSYRVISTSTGDSDSNVKVYDPDTGAQIGETLTPVVAGISITGP